MAVRNLRSSFNVTILCKTLADCGKVGCLNMQHDRKRILENTKTRVALF